MKHCIIKLERSTLTDKCDEDQLQPESEKLNLTKQYQHFLSKHKAALLIQKSYRMILLAIKNVRGESIKNCKKKSLKLKNLIKHVVFRMRFIMIM